MKLAGALFFLAGILFLTSCTQQNNDKLSNIQELEYKRDADSAKFISWLNSEDPEVRAQAVKSVGRIQDSSTIVWVANRLRDQNPDVREESAFAIGQFFSPAAEPYVKDAIRLEENRAIRTQLVESLGKVGTNESYRVVLGFIESDISPYERAGAIASGLMAYRGYPPSGNAESLGFLLSANKNPETNWRCAYALYRLSPASEIDVLMNALTMDNSLTRFFALKALNNIADHLHSANFTSTVNTKSVNEILPAFKLGDFQTKLSSAIQDTSWYVRLTAIQLAGTLKDPVFLHHIEEHLADPHPYIRSAALETLAEFNNISTEKRITDYIQNAQNWRDRGMALLNLAKLNPQKAMALVRTSIENVKWPENYYHIRVLSAIDNTSSTQLLLKLTDSDNAAQVSQVMESLITRQNVPISFFIKQLQRNDPAITTIAASKLAYLRDETAIPSLLKSYRYFQAPRDIEPMQAILVALDSIGSSQALPLLDRELSNPFDPIRKTAHRALRHITGKKVPLPDIEKKKLTRFDFPKIDPQTRPNVRFSTTKGEFVIELYPDKAPVTVANFIELVKSHFYDGIYFHRVVPGFVIQAGDPRGDGWGGPGYTIPCEYNDIFYHRGVVGMAHAGKDTGGSQFFITHTPQPHLNGRHTAFGRVISGMKAVDSMEIYDKILEATLIK